jgi:hypothetical protein
MTLSMLVSEPLHSLNASPLQADCRAPDGLNPANDALGNTSRAKPTEAIIPFRIVFMTFSPARAFGDGTMSPRQRSAVTMITKNAYSEDQCFVA